MANDPIIYVADAGSMAKGNFHWVSSQGNATPSDDPAKLASAISADLGEGRCVALGYECPLFVPCNETPKTLGCAREGECVEATGNRPFTAGAGASVFATGIQSLAWVLRQIKQSHPAATATTRWRDFQSGQYRLFVWEAFVSGSEKAYPPSHAGDASLAIDAFKQVMRNEANPTRVKCARSFSLAGAAILYAGLSTDVGLLSEPCVVLRPIFSAEESKGRLSGYKLRQAEAKKAKAQKTKGGDI